MIYQDTPIHIGPTLEELENPSGDIAKQDAEFEAEEAESKTTIEWLYNN
jgi:hypothetical protein